MSWVPEFLLLELSSELLHPLSGHDDSSSEIHIFRMLQILREFSTDPILCVYVIDDVWEYMKAMKVESKRNYFSLLHVHYIAVTCTFCSFYTIVMMLLFLQDWKCIISMLLDQNPRTGSTTDEDSTNLIRLLFVSIRKAVGEKIIPSTDNRKQYHSKAQRVRLSLLFLRKSHVVTMI